MRLTAILVLMLLFISCKDRPTEMGESSHENTSNVILHIDNPIEGDSQLPRLFATENEVYLSWVTKKDSSAILWYSRYKDQEWSPKEKIAEGSDWFTNWADFPNIAVNKGNILSHHLQKSANGTYTYDIKLNLYSHEEQSWKRDFILHTDGTQSEHGFVSMLPSGESGFFVTWLDGRHTQGGAEGHNSHAGGAMTLRSAFVDEEGQIFGDRELDRRVCDCCQTSAAMTLSGPVVVYRDRSEDEVRDISLVRYIDTAWSDPRTVYADNWKISGCPVNGPAIDAIDNHVSVAWFSEAKGKPKVQVIFSDDGGVNFGLPIRVDSNETIGRVDVKMLSATSAAILWMENVEEKTKIQLRRIDHDGARGPVITVASTSAERSTGFPRVVHWEGQLMIAWTELKDDFKTVRTALIPIELL